MVCPVHNSPDIPSIESTILILRYFVLIELWKTIVELYSRGIYYVNYEMFAFFPVTILSKLSFCIDNSAVDDYKPCNTLNILDTSFHVNGTVLKYLCSCHVVDLR